MALTAEEKAGRARQRMVDHARQFQIGTYLRLVARDFQKVIRAEAAAIPDDMEPAVVNGKLDLVFRRVGQCVCVTCGKVSAWGGSKGFSTGHFLASRCASIVLEEANVAPQCAVCNMHGGGRPELFRKWMEVIRGMEAIERLEKLKCGPPRSFTRDELVDLRIGYAARLKAAVEKMKGV